MSKPKKLDLKYEELISITTALNENILANKTRSKEQKINTDNFIMNNYSINRKDFTYTAKDYGIQFNQKLGLYDIPDCNTVASTKSNAEVMQSSNNIQNPNRIEELLLQLIDMVKDKKESNTKSNELNLDYNVLKGDVGSHCMKFYEDIYVEFQNVCNSYPHILKRDLASLALLDFINKYKKGD